MNTVAITASNPPSEPDCSRLFALPDIGMLSLDREGRIVRVNEFISSLLLYSSQDLHGRPLWELGDTPGPDQAQVATQQLQEQGHLRRTDLLLKSSDGLRFSFEFRQIAQLPNEERLIECQFQEVEVKGNRVAPAAHSANIRSDRRIVSSHRFEELALVELERTQKQGTPLSILSIGIDGIRHGKGSNGQHAPRNLRGVAKACADRLRESDIVGRLNDRAFIALLPGVGTKGAACAAERLRTAIAADETLHAEGGRKRVTLSIGVVSTRTGRIGYEAFLSRARAKSDDARNEGGNRVVF